MFELLIHKTLVFGSIVWILSFIIFFTLHISYDLVGDTSERTKKITAILCFIIFSPVVFVFVWIFGTIFYSLFLELIS